MKRILLILLLLATSLSLKAQVIEGTSAQSSLDYGLVPGPISYKDGKLLNSLGFAISKEQGAGYFEEAQYNDFLKASKKTSTASILNNIGAYCVGFAIGYPLGSLIVGGDIKKALPVAGVCLGLGVPFLAVGIPMWKSGETTLKGIADEYNASIQSQSYVPTFTIGGTANGFGIALTF